MAHLVAFRYPRHAKQRLLEPRFRIGIDLEEELQILDIVRQGTCSGHDGLLPRHGAFRSTQGNSLRRGLEAIQTAECGRNSNRTAEICTDPQRGAVHGKQRPLAAAGASGANFIIPRVDGPAVNVVYRIQRHHALGVVRLAVHDCAGVAQNLD